MFTRTITHTQSLLLALVLVLVVLGPAPTAQAQGYDITPASDSTPWYPYAVHYHRVYLGDSWYWSPQLGWHTHPTYTYLPHWVPVYYTAYPGSFAIAVVYSP